LCPVTAARASFVLFTIRSFSLCGILHPSGGCETRAAPENNAVRQRLFRHSRRHVRMQMWSVPRHYLSSVTLSRLFS
jgi:hypothetical protein